jgi:hypothetical protein
MKNLVVFSLLFFSASLGVHAQTYNPGDGFYAALNGVGMYDIRPSRAPQTTALPTIDSAQKVEMAATCFCSIMAGRGGNKPDVPTQLRPRNTVTEVFYQTQGGYIQAIDKAKCQGYCKGLWSAQNLEALAKQSMTPCGKVPLAVFAWCGTAVFEVVNTAVIDLGGQEVSVCPNNSWLHSDGKSCVTGTGVHVNGMPDQQLQGGYFFWKEDLFKIIGTAIWKCKM